MMLPSKSESHTRDARATHGESCPLVVARSFGEETLNSPGSAAGERKVNGRPKRAKSGSDFERANIREAAANAPRRRLKACLRLPVNGTPCGDPRNRNEDLAVYKKPNQKPGQEVRKGFRNKDSTRFMNSVGAAQGDSEGPGNCQDTGVPSTYVVFVLICAGLLFILYDDWIFLVKEASGQIGPENSFVSNKHPKNISCRQQDFSSLLRRWGTLRRRCRSPSTTRVTKGASEPRRFFA